MLQVKYVKLLNILRFCDDGRDVAWFRGYLNERYPFYGYSHINTDTFSGDSRCIKFWRVIVIKLKKKSYLNKQ